VNTELFLLDDLCSLINHLAKARRIIQIVQDLKGEKSWVSNASADAIPLFGQDHLPLVSPKQFFFAENEALYQFDGETFASIHPVQAPAVLFGVQACDLSAIAYQDIFFKNDPYYQARRQQILLVGIDCNAPCENGFCHLFDAGPQVAHANADLILSNLADTIQEQEGLDNWLLIASSDKGKAALEGLSLSKVPDDWHKKRQAFKQQVIAQFPDLTYINNGIEQINDRSVPAQVWEELSVRCLACSGCTNLCPTCSCYSTYTREDPETTTQLTLRCWDSCLFESFQREASGHNPSHGAGQRTERFWFHKFSDDYLPEFQHYGCVGCGRCEQTCPGSIGVHSVMRRINQTCCN
jgi:sulfhydrogenase subunit beta (sulfur reductase)